MAPFAKGGVFQLLLLACLSGYCAGRVLDRTPSSVVAVLRQPNLNNFFMKCAVMQLRPRSSTLDAYGLASVTDAWPVGSCCSDRSQTHQHVQMLVATVRVKGCTIKGGQHACQLHRHREGQYECQRAAGWIQSCARRRGFARPLYPYTRATLGVAKGETPNGASRAN